MMWLTAFYVYLCVVLALALVINNKSLTKLAITRQKSHPQPRRVDTEYPNLVRLAKQD